MSAATQLYPATTATTTAQRPAEILHGPVLATRICMDCRRVIGRDLWPWDRYGDTETTGLCDPCYAGGRPMIAFEDPDPAARFLATQREREREARAERAGGALRGAVYVFGAFTALYIIFQLIRSAI